MKRKVYFIGEQLKHARVTVIDVVPPKEGESFERIRYVVRCDRCKAKKTMAHSTLRQRISDKAMACLTCRDNREFGVSPPAWPVPNMLKNIPRWEK